MSRHISKSEHAETAYSQTPDERLKLFAARRTGAALLVSARDLANSLMLGFLLLRMDAALLKSNENRTGVVGNPERATRQRSRTPPVHLCSPSPSGLWLVMTGHCKLMEPLNRGEE